MTTTDQTAITIATRRYDFDGYQCVEIMQRSADGLTAVQTFGGHPQEPESETVVYSLKQYFQWLHEAPQQSCGRFTDRPTVLSPGSLDRLAGAFRRSGLRISPNL